MQAGYWSASYWPTTYWPTDYWQGLPVATAVYPDPAHVLFGIQYGPGGTGFTGALIVPVVVSQGLSAAVGNDAITATIVDDVLTATVED